MNVSFKFLADLLITDEIPDGILNLCPFMVIGMMPLCLGGIFKVDFTTVILCC